MFMTAIYYLCSTAFTLMAIWMAKEKEYILAGCAFVCGLQAMRFLVCKC